jgi:hypothetical protein
MPGVEYRRGIHEMIVLQIGNLVAEQVISGKAASCPEKEVLYAPPCHTGRKLVTFAPGNGLQLCLQNQDHVEDYRFWEG